MLLSAVMMLNYLGEKKSANILDKAILEVLTEEKYLTKDLGGTSSTMEMAEAIANKIKS
jgi:isocitrate/isopropylmalate dehydrogenase